MIPAEFSVRAGTKADKEQITTLIHAVLEEYGLVPEPDGVDNDLNDVEESYKNGYFGVIENSKVIVATYALYPLDESSVEIRKMYAHPSVRGKGLGKWMVNHLLEIAKHNGFREVELETATPLKEAIGLYMKLGFIEKDFEHKTPRCDKSFFMNI